MCKFLNETNDYCLSPKFLSFNILKWVFYGLFFSLYFLKRAMDFKQYNHYILYILNCWNVFQKVDVCDTQSEKEKTHK